MIIEVVKKWNTRQVVGFGSDSKANDFVLYDVRAELQADLAGWARLVFTACSATWQAMPQILESQVHASTSKFLHALLYFLFNSALAFYSQDFTQFNWTDELG